MIGSYLDLAYIVTILSQSLQAAHVIFFLGGGLLLRRLVLLSSAVRLLVRDMALQLSPVIIVLVVYLF